MTFEPGSQFRQRLYIEPRSVGLRELPHERDNRGVSEATLVPVEIGMRHKPRFEQPQKLQSGGAMLLWIGGMTIGIFVAVEVVFE